MRNRLPELLPDETGIETDIVIESTLAGAAEALLTRIGFTDKSITIVCDSNTHTALGERLLDELGRLRPGSIILQSKVHADEAMLKHLGNSWDALIAVGGGTISDLCKYVSCKNEKPYAVFPTAPSMNGYLSTSASMTLGGIKESKPAHLPKGIFCDLSVIASAPVRLIRS